MKQYAFDGNKQQRTVIPAKAGICPAGCYK